jgi:hypothetical protein
MSTAAPSKRSKDAPHVETLIGIEVLGPKKCKFLAMEKMLQKLEALPPSMKIAVFVLGGPQRKGKSTFMTHGVLGMWGPSAAQDGFQCGHSIDAVTVGMNMWSEFLDGVDQKTGEAIKIMVVDTEGIGSGAKHAGVNYDSNLLCLGKMMSSVFALNYHGSIESAAFQYLKTNVVDQCKRLRDGAALTEEPSAVVAAAATTDVVVASLAAAPAAASDKGLNFDAPLFVWLARDWRLKLESKGKPCSPNEYFEHALRNEPAAKSAMDEIFPNREFFTVPPPKQREDQGEAIVGFERKECNPLYVARCDEMVQRVRRQSPVKTDPAGKPMSGMVLAAWIRRYVQAINSGVLPNMEDSYSAMSNIACMSARMSAIAQWKEAAKKEKLVQMSPDSVNACFQKLRQAAVHEYTHGKMKAYGECLDKHLQELQTEIAECEREYRERNHEHVANVVMQRFNCIQADMDKCANFKDLTKLVEQVQKDTLAALNTKPGDVKSYAYTTVALEIASRWDSWVIMFSSRLVRREEALVKDIAERDESIKRMKGFMAEKDRDLDRLNQEKVELGKEHDKLVAQLKAQFTEQLDQQRTHHEQQMVSFETDRKSLESDLKELQTRETALREELQTAVTAHNQQVLEFDQRIQQQQEKLSAVEANTVSLETHNAELMQQVNDLTIVQVEATALRQDNTALQTQLETVQKDLGRTRTQFKQSQDDYQVRLKATSDRTEQVLSELQAKFQRVNQELSQRVEAQETKLSKADQARTTLQAELESAQRTAAEQAREQEKTYAKLQRELESAQKSANEAADYARQQREQADTFHRTEIEKLQTRLDLQKQQYSERMNELEQQHRRTTTELAARERATSEMQMKIDHLTQQKKELSDQLTNQRKLESDLQNAKFKEQRQDLELKRLQDLSARMRTENQELRQAVEDERTRCTEIQTRAQEELSAKRLLDSITAVTAATANLGGGSAAGSGRVK